MSLTPVSHILRLQCVCGVYFIGKKRKLFKTRGTVLIKM